jgi:hypothetical protein
VVVPWVQEKNFQKMVGLLQRLQQAASPLQVLIAIQTLLP